MYEILEDNLDQAQENIFKSREKWNDSKSQNEYDKLLEFMKKERWKMND